MELIEPSKTQDDIIKTQGDILENASNKKKSSFKEYYKTHDEFRQKHLEKSRERIMCDGCGKSVPRSNMSAHKKTKKHLNVINKDIIEKLPDINEVVKRLNEEHKKVIGDVLKS